MAKEQPGGTVLGAGQTMLGRLDLSGSRLAMMSDQAMALYQSGQREPAREIFKRILDEDVEHAGALHGMGLVARDMGRLPVAAELMRRALKRDPKSPMIHSNLGTVYEAMEEFEQALASYKEAAKHVAKHPIVYNNLGSVLSKLGRRTEALVALRKAVEYGAVVPETLTNLATMLCDLGDFRQAEPYFRKALELDPEHAQAHHNYGVNLLRQGRWSEGWFHHEWRMVATNRGVPWRAFPQPLWNGNPFPGARLILFAEQGIGDEIRYASMIPEAIARGGEVVVECAPRLVSLFQRSFPQTRVVPAPYLAAETGREPFDIMCPFGTLGRLFRQSVDAFPRHRGYIVPDHRRIDEYRERLASAAAGPYIGLCWRSGLAGAFRSEYYAGIEDMRAVLEVQGATFVNLQYDATAEELAEARRLFGVDLVAWDDLDLKNDLEGAAALTRNMDLVISPATSVSVMAGALGVETIEFRPFPIPDSYFRDGRCPWFPSVRFFCKRQSERWQRLLRSVAAEVKALVETRGAGGRV